ncbi:hypothetical protein ACEN2I_17090 [Flavobacterium sp. W22_SRS_FK3]|uniref:hypothetical protein n=1 Tax=Flavobacterium sp. W22_SRS_FK3 TaxID=3240275 RepID=UPI003F904EB1
MIFTRIAQIKITGDLQITIKQGAENNWVVSVLLNDLFDHKTEFTRRILDALLNKPYQRVDTVIGDLAS